MANESLSAAKAAKNDEFYTQISVIVKITPFKVMEIYASVAVNVMVEHKYLSAYRGFAGVELWRILLKKGWLIRSLVFLTLRSVGC